MKISDYHGFKLRDQYKILFIVIISFFLRAYGLNFGLGFAESRPDETIAMHNALRYGTGDLNPHDFHWPSLFSYLLFILYGAYTALAFLFGHFSSWEGVIKEITFDPVNFLLISRLVSVICSSISVYLIYKIGVCFYKNKLAGIIAAIFLGFTYLDVRNSHFGTPDSLMVLLVMCTIYFICRTHDNPALKNYLCTGAAYGLAVSAKYNAVFLVAPLIIMQYLICKKNQAGYFTKNIFFLGFFTLIAFTLGTPFWIIDFPAFFSDVTFEIRHLINGHEGIVLGRGWWYHLKFSLWYGMGPVLLALSLAGLIRLFLRDVKKSLLVFSFPLVYYVFFGYGYTVFVRHMLPILPFAALSAALLVTGLFKKHRFFAIILVGLTVLFPLSNAIQFDNIINKKDNRVIAAQWIEKNIPVGSSIGFAGSKYSRIKLPEGYRLSQIYESLSGQETEVSINQPIYLIVERSPLFFYSYIPDNLNNIIKEKYRILKAFFAESGNKGIYDQQDAFYIPYAGFSKVIRPGPDILIYIRK